LYNPGKQSGWILYGKLSQTQSVEARPDFASALDFKQPLAVIRRRPNFGHISLGFSSFIL
jgi:hypothetical protein